MGFRERSIPAVILLSLFTCGIYPLYYVYTTQEAMRYEYWEEPVTSGAMTLILTFITCGIYSIYWMYVTSKRLDYIVNRDTGNYSDDTLLFVLIGVFLTPIAFNALVQNKINTLLVQRDGY